jgi:hypothetical protein
MVANERGIGANAVFADLVQVGLGRLLPVTSLLAKRLVLVPRACLVNPRTFAFLAICISNCVSARRNKTSGRRGSSSALFLTSR